MCTSILVADDDVMLRNLLRTVLRREGYEVLTAADGAEVLEVSRAHSKRIDLLLTDVKMPKMDGLAAYQQIRARRPDIKVLFMSGDVESIRVPETVPFLSKPFLPDELKKTIKKVLETHQPGPIRPRIILVVDSLPPRLERTVKILTSNGYAALTARSVEEAEAVTDGLASVDLIISGVIFPGVSGIHLAEHVEASERTINTLLISHFEPDVLRGLAGFSRQPEFLQNPFTPEELLTRVYRLLPGT